MTVVAAEGKFGRNFELKSVGLGSQSGRSLFTVTQRGIGADSARIPKDSRGGVYAITPGAFGEQFVLVDKRVPTVLYAPKYWVPPDLKPASRWRTGTR